MAPGRKRGANKLKTANELSLGDLVLAKVKGFPAWPAKVSRPEDWERTPDPRKYFVQFFGTQEIAFVAPADVQAFTSESKSKLLARCRGKTVKYFAQAVKEICEAFEELQQSDFGDTGDDTDTAAPGRDVADANGEVRGLNACASLSGGCSGGKDMLNHKSERGSVTPKKSSLLPEISEMFTNFVKDGTLAPKESGTSVPSSSPSSFKEETNPTALKANTVTFCERIQSSRASSSSPHSGRSDVERDTNKQKSGMKDNPFSLGASSHVKVAASGAKKLENGHKSKEVTSGSKRKLESVAHHNDISKSSGNMKDRVLGHAASGGNGNKLSLGGDKSESNVRGKAMKHHQKVQKRLDAGKSPKVSAAAPKDQKSDQLSVEQSQSSKKAKYLDMSVESVKGSLLKNGKSNLEPGVCDDDAFLPQAKRHRALEDTSSVKLAPADKKTSAPTTYKSYIPKKRRAVRLDDDDDDEPKTPVHGRSIPAPKVSSSSVIECTKKNEESPEISFRRGENLRGSGDGDESLITAALQQRVDHSLKVQASHSPRKEDFGKRPIKEAKADLISPTKSPLAASVVNKLVDQKKPNRPSVKAPNSVSHSKAYNGSGKGPDLLSGTSNSYQTQASSQKSRQVLSAEKLKGTSKVSMRLSEPAASIDNQRDHSIQGGRPEDSQGRSGSLVESKAGDSSISIKNLIAAAQAKRRQSQIQNYPHGNGSSMLGPTTNLQGRSPSPSSAGQSFPSDGVNATQLDAPGVESRGSVPSPSGHIHQLASLDSVEPGDKGHSLTYQASGSTLSGGTEAAVARDAFEGMIETLSRTKESIGRATRLAIDCAKHGIANEVVDLLVSKLESEQSNHRRVDLFFLVDSITQCSHSQKGVAGASYIPIVQSALPRLLGAAAPPGASARENRRQCLKVLRLWLERKILPESVLRRFMDDIGGSNNELTSGLSLRRPSRAERSVDDPIREMEGMLVDEYGSNATFNLPGFLSSHGFVDDDEDEEDLPRASVKEFDASPLELLDSSPVLESGKVTPGDRRHHILEDVDGELEMEDVSGHLKDGASSPIGLLEKDKQEMLLDTEQETSTDKLFEPPPFEGSPPLPLESPPPLPPLPSSPPPPPPPPLSPSPPPPPPPSSLPSQPPPPPLLPSGPPQAGNVQPLPPQQPSVTPQVLPQPPSAPPGQAPLPPDYNISTGSHPSQMAGTLQQVPCFIPARAPGLHDTSGYSSRPREYGHREMYAGSQSGQPNQQFQTNQQFQPCQTTFDQRPFPPVPVPQLPSNHYAYNKPTVQQHISHPPAHPPPHPHPHLPPLPPGPAPPSLIYPSASHSEGSRRFADEQWRSPSVEFNADNPHNPWVNGGRPAACPTTTFVGEAYFRPPERPPANNMGYQVSAQGHPLQVPSASGQGMNQMLPSRPDMSSLNCWRPV